MPQRVPRGGMFPKPVAVADRGADCFRRRRWVTLVAAVAEACGAGASGGQPNRAWLWVIAHHGEAQNVDPELAGEKSDPLL